MKYNKPTKTKDFIRFLEGHDCMYKRTRASHDHYKCPKCFRTITFRGKAKEIPFIHLASNLKTMNMTVEYYYNWLKEN